MNSKIKQYFLFVSLQTVFTMIFLTVLSGCVSYHREMGLENIWREKSDFMRGKTSQADVMKALGPPSQVIDLNGRTVLYYLQERVIGKKYYFLIYNTANEKTIYDRAMFIFDSKGILEDFAYSHEDLNQK